MKTTRMAYQLESNRGVIETNISTLSQAKKKAENLSQKNVSGLQIARYDASEKSIYYEIVFTIT
jgi:hypothetical protein